MKHSTLSLDQHDNCTRPFKSQYTRYGKAASRRRLPFVFGNNFKLEEKFWRILNDEAGNLVVYVYRHANNQVLKPYIFKGYVFSDLVKYIRDSFGSGEYAILIRGGKAMKFSGVIAVQAPQNRKSQTSNGWP